MGTANKLVDRKTKDAKEAKKDLPSSEQPSRQEEPVLPAALSALAAKQEDTPVEGSSLSTPLPADAKKSGKKPKKAQSGDDLGKAKKEKLCAKKSVKPGKGSPEKKKKVHKTATGG